MVEWRWRQRIDRHLDESAFLGAHESGATIGKNVGGAAGGAALVVGVAYLGSAVTVAGATTLASSEAAVTTAAATASAGSVAAERAYHAGYFAGKKLGAFVLKESFKSAVALGKLGGAYAGAAVQAGAGWAMEQGRGA